MTRPPHLPIRAALVVAGVSPLVWGTAAMLDGQLVIALTGWLSRASYTMTPELDYMRKPLGIYVAMFGALLLYAASDPLRHRAIVTWGALLFIGRGIQRLAVTSQLHEVFAIPVGVNLVHGTYVVAIGLVLLALRPRGAASP